eukprot:2190847-Pleurochrysis_carterae.AAC.4
MDICWLLKGLACALADGCTTLASYAEGCSMPMPSVLRPGAIRVGACSPAAVPPDDGCGSSMLSALPAQSTAPLFVRAQPPLFGLCAPPLGGREPRSQPCELGTRHARPARHAVHRARKVRGGRVGHQVCRGREAGRRRGRADDPAPRLGGVLHVGSPDGLRARRAAAPQVVAAGLRARRRVARRAAVARSRGALAWRSGIRRAGRLQLCLGRRALAARELLSVG